MAYYIKKRFDKKYQPNWQVIVGLLIRQRFRILNYALKITIFSILHKWNYIFNFQNCIKTYLLSYLLYLFFTIFNLLNYFKKISINCIILIIKLY